MKRSPLKRYTRLRPIGKTAHARRKRHPEYIEVDHAFGRYRKNSDLETVPLCRKHHREKTGVVGGSGFMAGWSRARRRGWLGVAVAWVQAWVAANGDHEI